MGKSGEIDYLTKGGPDFIRHAKYKPFSDINCAGYLMEFGGLMALLPPPPARVLDLGCGTGWTSRFLAKTGYETVAIDISPEMIFHAEEMRQQDKLDNLSFVVADYEDLQFLEEFDAVVFYDSLHHAVDEELALRKAYQALRPGGVCLASEPGEGHSLSEAAVRAVERFDVTEKDMPPRYIMEIGRRCGFRDLASAPPANLNRAFDLSPPPVARAKIKWRKKIRRALWPLPHEHRKPLKWLAHLLLLRSMDLTSEQFEELWRFSKHLRELSDVAARNGLTRMVK